MEQALGSPGGPAEFEFVSVLEEVGNLSLTKDWLHGVQSCWVVGLQVALVPEWQVELVADWQVAMVVDWQGASRVHQWTSQDVLGKYGHH